MLNWLDNKASIYTMRDRPDYLTDDKWIKRFSLLNKYGLSFDLQIYQHQMNDAAQLAREYSNTTIVLNHCGKSFFLKEKSVSNAVVKYRFDFDGSMESWYVHTCTTA